MKMNSDIEKMLKDVVKRVSASRPSLQCVHFENGDAIVTDSHRLIKVKGLAPKDLKLDLNLADFSFPDISYPDTDRLISKEFLTSISLTKADIIELLPALKAMANNSYSIQPIINLDISGDNFKIYRTDKRTQSMQSVSLKLGKFSGEDISMSCDGRFLADAFEALTRIKDTRVLNFEMKFNTPLQPFLISAGNIDYLITPVRVF